MFDGDFVWKPSTGNSAIEIRSVWKDLPNKFDQIDAVFENEDKTLWFLIKTSVYIFNNTTLLRKQSLQDFGIDEHKYSKIDAIFRWPYNERVYIFSGEDYWLLEGSKVRGDYPKTIEHTWRDVFDVDTVFSMNQSLFVLKEKNFFEFDSRCMTINRMTPEEIGPKFLNCPMVVKAARKIHHHVVTFEPQTKECLDDGENIERLPKVPAVHSTKDNSNVLSVSFNVPSNVLSAIPGSLTLTVATFVFVLFF